MGKFKYYYDLMSQPSRALYIAFKLTGVPFENCPVALRKGESFTDAYKKINRFQKVPCIVDTDGFKLSESIAILRYLDAEKNLMKTLYPIDRQLRARIDEYLEWQHNNTRLGCAMYFRKEFLEPILLGIEKKPAEIKELKKLMESVLDIIENIWLEKNQFLCGNTMTIADIFGACEIEQTLLTGYDPTENRPKLKKWLQAVKTGSNPHYDEAHQFVYKLTAKRSNL